MSVTCDHTPLQLCPPDPPFSRTLLSCFHLVTEIDVSKTLKSMSFKSCELDPIPASLLTAFHTYFLPSLTSKTILLHTVNDSLLASDSGKVLLLTLLSAAFNTIDHTILLTHLEYTFEIHSTALAWFVLSVQLVPKSVCQQQAVQSCQTFLWHPSRFYPGACPLHPLYYPSSLHHQPSQLESPLLC